MPSRVLFVAEALRAHQPFYDRFYDLMPHVNVRFTCLWGVTNNLWCRDYMPVATAQGTLVQFRYWPDYLVRSPKYRSTIVDASTIGVEGTVPRVHSDLIVDGGNVVLGPGCAILTRKVMRENPHYTRKKLLAELERVFSVDRIILIPEDPHEFTGHADGMVRVYNADTVLVNDYRKEDPDLGRKVRRALHQAGLHTIEVPYAPRSMGRSGSAVGCYINFLRHEGGLVVPSFGIPEDDGALRRFEELFPKHIVRDLYSRDIALKGGVLNCITWAAKPDWQSEMSQPLRRP